MTNLAVDKRRDEEPVAETNDVLRTEQLGREALRVTAQVVISKRTEIRSRDGISTREREVLMLLEHCGTISGGASLLECGPES